MMDETVIDPLLCMQGVMLASEDWMPVDDTLKPGMHIVKMVMHRNARRVTSLRYGMVGGDKGNPEKEYSKVMSPKCPHVLCEATCLLKLSKSSLHTQDCAFLWLYLSSKLK